MHRASTPPPSAAHADATLDAIVSKYGAVRPPKLDPEAERALFDEVGERMAKADARGALTCMNRLVLGVDAPPASYFLLRATVRNVLGDLSGEFFDITAALRQKDRSIDTARMARRLEHLSVLVAASGTDWGDAERVYRASPHHDLGVAALKAGDLGEAVARFGDALAIRQAATTLWYCGVALSRLFEIEWASLLFDRIDGCKKADLDELHRGVSPEQVKEVREVTAKLAGRAAPQAKPRASLRQDAMFLMAFAAVVSAAIWVLSR